MVENCEPTSGFEVFDIAPSERLATHKKHRDILIREFGVKPAYADYFLWSNPVGADTTIRVSPSHDGALYGPGETPSSNLPAILEALDEANLGRLPGTDQAFTREQAYTDPQVYLAMFQHLGWPFEIDADGLWSVPTFVPADSLGSILDPELGTIPVFYTGLTSNPESHYDHSMQVLTDWARQQQSGSPSPLVVLFSEPMVKTTKDGSTSVFGIVVSDGNCWMLPLRQGYESAASMLVEAMASGSIMSAEVQDLELIMARRFANAKEDLANPNRPAVGQAATVITYEGSGWGRVSVV